MNDDMSSTGAVLALWNDVAPELDAEYNEWHANEHVPERLTVPGMLWGRRYQRSGDSVAPRYLTIYGMRDARVVESEAYRLLLSQPTPMSARMRPHLCNLSRWVCDVCESQKFGASTNMAVWTFDEEDVARLRTLNTPPAAVECCSAEDRSARRPCHGSRAARRMRSKGTGSWQWNCQTH